MKIVWLLGMFVLMTKDVFAYIDLGLAGRVFQLFYLMFFSFLLMVAAPTLFFWKNICKWLKRHWKLAALAFFVFIFVITAACLMINHIRTV